MYTASALEHFNSELAEPLCGFFLFIVQFNSWKNQKHLTPARYV